MWLQLLPPDTHKTPRMCPPQPPTPTAKAEWRPARRVMMPTLIGSASALLPRKACGSAFGATWEDTDAAATMCLASPEDSSRQELGTHVYFFFLPVSSGGMSFL